MDITALTKSSFVWDKLSGFSVGLDEKLCGGLTVRLYAFEVESVRFCWVDFVFVSNKT